MPTDHPAATSAHAPATCPATPAPSHERTPVADTPADAATATASNPAAARDRVAPPDNAAPHDCGQPAEAAPHDHGETATAATADAAANDAAANDTAAPDPPRPQAPTLLRAIAEGQLDPRKLSALERQDCVAHLTDQGCTAHEIAGLLKTTERTVRRDRAAFRRDHALSPHPRLGDELLGEFQRLTLASIARLIRAATDKNAPPYARLWSDEAISRTYQRFLHTALRLKYLQDGQQRLHDAEHQGAQPHDLARVSQLLYKRA